MLKLSFIGFELLKSERVFKKFESKEEPFTRLLSLRVTFPPWNENVL